jgi:two-component system sensor histidine kinase AgrC
MDGISVSFAAALYAAGSVLLLLLTGGFLLAVGGAHRRRLEEQLRLARLREEQYRTLEAYLEQTRKARHDFRHAVRTIDELAGEGKLEELRGFVREYVRLQPEQAAACRFCAHPAANAIFRSYAGAAEAQGIRLSWQTEVPDGIPVSDVDLTAVLGNILENAIRTCAAVPEGERYIRLRVDTDTPGALFITAANSFDGKPALQNGRFLSTRKDGGGLGLASVAAAAKKYGGAAQFSCRGREFQSSVMLRLDGRLAKEA